LDRNFQTHSAEAGLAKSRNLLLGTNGYTSDGFRDVLNGNNTFINAQGETLQGFAAGPGFDIVTGWGTADIADFVNAFSSILATEPGKLQITPASGNFGTVKVGNTKLIHPPAQSRNKEERYLGCPPRCDHYGLSGFRVQQYQAPV
jgi:hypothetical protein